METMNKKKLLKLLQNSTLRYDSQKEELYNNFFPIIQAKLEFCPDNLDLSDALSLDENFEDAEAFEIFIRNSSCKEIEDKFNNLISDLSTLASIYLKNNMKRFSDEAMVLAVGNNKLVREQKRTHVFNRIFISVFILLAAGALAFSLLEEFGVFDWGGHFAAIIGMLDFLNGVAFFIYEERDDQKKNKLQDDMMVALGHGSASRKNAGQSGIKTKNVVKGNVVNGNGNVVGNTVNVDGMPKELSDFLIRNGQRDSEKK